MVFEGCKGKPDPLKVIEKTCPNCGSVIEMFPIDTKMSCDKCGFVAYNDTISCVRWCASARSCVGDEMYFHVQEMIKKENEAKALEEAAKADTAVPTEAAAEAAEAV